MLRLFILLSLSAVSLSAQAADSNSVAKQCQEFPTTKKMKLQSVASEMGFNDIPMTIRRFESSEETPEAILNFYRAKWAATAQVRGPAEYPLGPWQVIATLREPCFYTVQVKALGKGSEGLLGVSAPPSEKPIVKEAVPMLPGTRVVNDLAHNDAGKTARTLLLKNGFSSETNADFYRKNFGEQGWQVLSQQRGSDKDMRGDVLIMKKGVREVSVTATQSGKESTVVVNYVDQP
jgi:hypothetical protein